MLRTVGHVLDKVDSNSDPKIKIAVEQKWENLKKSKPEPKIFWGFIEEGRNNILKEYELGEQTTLTVETPLYNARTGEQVSMIGQEPRPPSYQYLVKFGPFTGKSQKKVISEAIKWWEDYLDDIDRLSGKTTNA